MRQKTQAKNKLGQYVGQISPRQPPGLENVLGNENGELKSNVSLRNVA